MTKDDSKDDVFSPENAFEVLAHEIRLRTIETLDEATEPLSFGELRHRVSVDDPGRFNYHLQKVDDRFVRLDESGYRLTPAGTRVVGAVVSGGFTGGLATASTSVPGACTVCAGDLELTVGDHRVRIACRNCEWTVTEPAVPPILLEAWEVADVPEAVSRWLTRNDLSASLGICPNCDGRMDRSLALPDEGLAPEWFQGFVAEAVAISECRHCSHWWHTIVERATLVHPAVIAFHQDHGIDVLATPPWELGWMVHHVATISGTEPLRVKLTIELGDEVRTFVFDRELELVE